MKRIVETEWLDELPPDDPRALRSRRDLRRVNFFMRNVEILERMLRKAFSDQSPRKLVELGAGDGTFLLNLARKLSPQWRNVEVVFVDRVKTVSAETLQELDQLGWRAEMVCADIFEWLPKCDPVDCMMANLFLHHFEAEKLALLLGLAASKSKMFFACEPRRSALALAGTGLLGLIGCNDVTRHDARVSVRAGFHGKEISERWPRTNGWDIQENRAGLFGHGFVAKQVR